MKEQKNFTYPEMVQIGQESAALLNSQVWLMAYMAVLEDLQERFFNAEPGHTRTLEEIRREGNALGRVVTNLSRAISQANQIVAAQQQEGQSE